LSQVYSFVPIPGDQQHKRVRRRHEEIDRMYECGWSGCKKAYGTLNHLNAHVTMQSHGQKRAPEGILTPLSLSVVEMNTTPSRTLTLMRVGWLFVESHSILYCFDFKLAKCLAS
jgi:hypothetical protein